MQNSLPYKLRQAYRLLKPGMGLAILVTIVPGLLTGMRLPSTRLVLSTLIGTFLVATSSFIYNQIIEARRDQLMDRTKDRPLSSGELSLATAYGLASALLIAGLVILFLMAHPLAMLIALVSFLIYVFVYTILLKTRTPLNTIIGGLSGAVGPMIGEAAIHGTVGQQGWMLFLLLFIWQPAHFWVLAIRYREDYQKAGIRMLPVVHGIKRTYREILLFQSLLLGLIVLSAYPLRIFLPQMPYLLLALVLTPGLWIWYKMWKLAKKQEPRHTLGVFFMTIGHMLWWHIVISVDLAWKLVA